MNTASKLLSIPFDTIQHFPVYIRDGKWKEPLPAPFIKRFSEIDKVISRPRAFVDKAIWKY